MPIKKVFETPWFHIEEEEFTEKSGIKNLFYRIVTPPGVLIFALTPENKIIMVKQFRPVLRQRTLEIPAGEIDKGEDPRAAAIRELYEETGFEAKTIDIISPKLYTVPNRLSQEVYVFLAKGAVKNDEFQPKEDIEVVLMSKEEFINSVKKGEIPYVGVIAAFSLWQNFKINE